MLSARERCWFPVIAAVALCGSISSTRSQEQLPGIFGVFTGIINSAIGDETRREWQTRPVADYNCLTSRNLSADQLAASGTGPNDPRIRQLGAYAYASWSASFPTHIGSN